MNTLREAVARACFAELGNHNCPWDILGEDIQKHWLRMADAAIVAVLRHYIAEFGESGDIHVALELNERLDAALIAGGRG